MRLELLYFASARERLGLEREQLNLPDDAWTVAALQMRLAGRGGVWAELFGNGARLLAAVNQTMARSETNLADGDEVAFFPPVTGG